MKFLYTVICDHDGTYRLSSSSALKEEFEQSQEVRYFTAYPDASDTLKQSFELPNTHFSQRNETYEAFYVPVFSDRWGTYRSIFVPMRSPTGKTYVVGADIDISYVQALLRQNTLKTLLEFVIFLLVILPIVYVYVNALKQKTQEYQHVHRLYMDQSKRSVTDSLTQLYNRLKLDEELEIAFEHYQKHNKPFALIMIDIDHFKAVNDRFGHQVGDTVLRHISKLLADTSRASDIVGRWGGEEFLIICQDTNVNGAYQLAEKLRASIERYVIEKEYGITASFGVGEAATDMGRSQFLQQVDEALYEAKRKGRNRIEIVNSPVLQRYQNT